MNTEINQIWKEHHNQLLEFVKKKVNDKSEAEDILQEVFMKILSKIDTLKDSDKLKSWIYQITRNAIVDYYRKQKKENNQEFGLFSPVDESDENSTMNEVESWIGLYVKGLPENYQQALVLSELKGLSIAEIADTLNISYTNARVRVHRGRLALKKNLTDCCTFHVDVYGNILDYYSNHPTCKEG